jgi:hypothetical protein
VFRGVLFVQTEPDGTFMFRDVRPGEYYVHAYSPGGHRPARGGPGAAYTSTYFPDAISLDGAQRIAVGSGQELSSIDFALRAVQTHTVSGLLVDAAGPPLTSARIQLMPLQRSAVVEGPSTMAALDGTFQLEDVLPGSYIVTVGDDAASDRWMGATRQITVVDDRTVLVIPATPGSRFEGRVTIPEDEALPFPITNLSVRISQRWADSSALSTFGGDIATDGTFAFTGGVGETSVVMGGRIPPGWHVRWVAIDGIDMTDRPFDVLPTDRRRIDIVLSARGGTLQGITTDSDAKPVPQALVVLFPDDWARLSRTRLVRTAFSVQRGQFEMDDIPPGNYRAVAVRWLPRDAWTDGEVLTRLWPSSEPVTISADEPVRLQLMVTEPPEDLFR